MKKLKMNSINNKKELFIMFTFLLMFLCSNVKGSGQDEMHEMKLLARPTSDSIMLRWGPTTYPLWQLGNQYGYKITRTTLLKDGKYLDKPKAKLLNSNALKPFPLDKWEKLSDNDNYAGVAAQAIYGDDFDVETNNDDPSMIDIINRASVQESRFGFALFSADQSIKVAQYSGLYYADKEVKKGEKYLYRVFPAFVPAGMQVDTAYVFTGVDEYMPLPAPIKVSAEAGDKMVTISWDKKYQESFYNSYWVEKSMDNGLNYKRVNDLPLVNTTPEGYDESDFGFLIDSLINNNQKYVYRVIGISIFGELSPPSKPVEIKGKNIISSVPLVHLSETTDGASVLVKWEYPKDKKDKIDGFRIFRSDQFAKGYRLLADSIPMYQASFTDKKALLTGYYRMQAYNADGHGPYSIPKMLQLVDSIPPAIPQGLRAVADTSGLVKLSWTANSDFDIFGYRVYRANSKYEEFSQLTSKAISSNAFRDSIALKTLTKKVYYKIIAVDRRQNESAFSDIMELERPDIVPPSAPFINSIKSTKRGIEIHWVKSASSDVEKQVLYRNTKGESQWALLKVLSADSIQYTDDAVLSQQVYRYLLLAVDKAGNESKAPQAVAAKFLDAKPTNLWIQPKIEYSKKSKETLLTWEMPDFKVQRFMIYYKNEDGIWRLLDGVRPNKVIYRTKLVSSSFKIFCK